MDIEEIDNRHDLGVTKANEFFLDGLRRKKDKKILDSSYRLRLRKVAETYKKDVENYIKKERKKKKANKPVKKETIEHFKVKKEYDRSLINKINIKYKIFVFRCRMRLRVIREKILGKDNLYIMKKMTIVSKSLFFELKIRVRYHYNRAIRKILDISERCKNYLAKRYISVKEKIKGFFLKFRKKKAEPAKEESNKESS